MAWGTVLEGSVVLTMPRMPKTMLWMPERPVEMLEVVREQQVGNS